MTNSARGTVLIIEDDDGVAELESRLLERSGFAVRLARTATEALDVLQSGPVDLVVMDYLLPGGITAFELIPQTRNLNGEVPIIMVTGCSSEQTVIRALRLGVRDFVPKTPDFLEYLTAAVDRVSDGIRTRRRLAEAESRFQLFMDNSPAIAFMKEPDGRFVYANRRFETASGCVDWQGRTDFDFWSRATAESLLANEQAVLKSGSALQFSETLETLAGATIHWLTYRFPLRRADGQLLLAGMAVDVTSQRATEELLKERESQLRHAQKMEAIGQLAGGVAHDFNNLLTVIQGYTDILIENPHDAEAVSMLREVQRAAQRAALLTRQLLVFSRKQVSELKTLNINYLVLDTEKMLRRLIGEHIEFVTQLAPDLGYVCADPTNIEQILVNLVVNARDAMPQGGEISLETANVQLDDTYSHHHAEVTPGSYIMLAVGDTGCGMDEATVARIFEPFFTTKAPGKGTGLGLATVYGAVRQVGGHIGVYSEPGQGSIFRVYLPRVDHPSDLSGHDELIRPDAGSETILVVEDDDSVRAITVAALGRGGYTVLQAANPTSALQLSQQFAGDIQLLLTDVVMPQFSGARLAELLSFERPEMRVMFLSGYTDDSVIRQGILQRNVNFLQKPFTAAALLKKVREVLDGGVHPASPPPLPVPTSDMFPMPDRIH